MAFEYIKRKQKQLEKKRQREAEAKAKLEAERVAKREAELREQQEIATRKKLLLERQEAERLRHEHAQRKEELAAHKWEKQLGVLLDQMESGRQEEERLEEIRIIIQKREPSLQELDWTTWLSDPLNQRLVDLDLSRAMEMFKRDNLLAKRRKATGGKKKPYISPWVLGFSGNEAGASDSFAKTDFNPDDYGLNLGFTVSYWVRPDQVGATRFAFGRKHSNSQRFTFGINKANQVYVAVGGNKLTRSFTAMGVPASQLAANGTDLKTDGTWYHFVVTYADRVDTSAAAERRLYINGVQMDTGASNINWSNTGGGTAGVIFGGRFLGGTGYNNGWACGLSQLAIFDTAQSAAWVNDIYNAGRTGTNFTGQNALVGYWKFNKGSGTTVKDYSVNGNDGTFAPISGDTTAYPAWEKVN